MCCRVLQAAVLGMSPKVTIIHTGKNIEGQVYLPEINYILMILCIAVTAGFQSSDNLGHAYGGYLWMQPC